MRHSLHIINSLALEKGGTSVSVPALTLATAATGRYKNTLLQAAGQCNGGSLGPRTALATADFSPLQLFSNRPAVSTADSYVRNTDIVHVHGIWQTHSLTACMLASRHKKPLVISAHGMLEPWALRNKSWKKLPYGLVFERRNLRNAALLRALTPEEASEYRSFGLKNRIAIIPNGTDDQSNASPNLAYDTWPQLRGRRIVLFLSRIHYKKGVDLLVKAWSEIASQFPDALLVISGPDSEGTLSMVEQIMNEKSLNERILLTGAVFGELKSSLLNAASLFVLPSHSEGFSMAILEALSAGLPVIITKACYFPEVSTRDAGWIITPNVTEIVAALSDALSSSTQELRSRGLRGHELVRSKYEWSSIGRQMADAFDWVLGGPRPNSMEIWES